MPTQTLAQLRLRVDDEIVQGIAEDIITTNPIFRIWPFLSFTGPAVKWNRESVLGDVGLYSIGDTITHKNPMVLVQVFYEVTKLIGDVEMDKLLQLQGESDGVDQTTDEIASKSKNVGRQFQEGIAIGTGVAPQFNSLHTLTDAAQYTPASAGQDLSFALMHELADLVKSKDGQLDFFTCNGFQFRRYLSLVNSVSAVTPDWIREQFGNTHVAEFNGVPVFQNDYLPQTETADGAALTGGALSSMYAGAFDDGTRRVGLTGLFPAGAPAGGIQVEPLGTSFTKDEDQWRVKMYANNGLFNRRGLARLPSLNQ